MPDKDNEIMVYGLTKSELVHPIALELGAAFGLDPVRLEIDCGGDLDVLIQQLLDDKDLIDRQLEDAEGNPDDFPAGFADSRARLEAIINKLRGGNQPMVEENIEQKPFQSEVEREGLAEALARKYGLGDGGAESLMLLAGDDAGKLQRVAKAIHEARLKEGEAAEVIEVSPESERDKQRKSILEGPWLPTAAELEAMTPTQYARLRESGWSGELAPSEGAVETSLKLEKEGILSIDDEGQRTFTPDSESSSEETQPSAEELDKMSTEEYARWFKKRSQPR